MQHLEGSGTPVLYIGRTVLKGDYLPCVTPRPRQQNVHNTYITNLRMSDSIQHKIHIK
jgi:hypothetical protein